MSNGLLYLLEIGLVIAVFGGGWYWACGAVSRSGERRRKQRREDLAARTQYRQPWNPDSTSGRGNR